jgi:hypothetical protein
MLGKKFIQDERQEIVNALSDPIRRVEISFHLVMAMLFIAALMMAVRMAKA